MSIRGFWLLLLLALVSFACSSEQLAEPSLETDQVAEQDETGSPEPGDAPVAFTAVEIEALQQAVISAQEEFDLAGVAADDAADAARIAGRESESFRRSVSEGAAAASDTLQEASAAARVATDQVTASARNDATVAAQLATEASDVLNGSRQDLLEANVAELEAALTESDAMQELRDAELALYLAEGALDEAEDAESRSVDPLVGPADWPTWMAEPESVIAMVTVDLPRVPIIAPPDLSPPTELSNEIETELGSLFTPSSGVDVLTARCVADGGPLRYATAADATDLLDAAQSGASLASIVGPGRDFVVSVNSTGAGSFVDFTGSTFVQASRNADDSGAYQDFTDGRFIRFFSNGAGFGTLIDRGGDNNYLLSLNEDGTGSLEDLGGSTSVVVLVRSDGSATYRDLTDSLSFEYAVNADGSWFFHDRTGRRSEELNINADGTGIYEALPGGGVTTIEVGSLGAARYRVQSDERDVEVALFADGSWTLDDRSGDEDRKLAIASDGSGWFESDGESGRLSSADTAPLTALVEPLLAGAEAGTLLQPDLVTTTSQPEFAIAERFPPVGTLPNLARPCATVVRFDASILFDGDNDDLRPGADRLLDEVAAALRRNDQVFEVHGHTNAIGSEQSNLGLSERWAQVVAEGLIERGATIETVVLGLGESQPAVPNELADGSDNRSAERLNNRVEIVLFEAG